MSERLDGETVGVVGAGSIGAGMSLVFACAGARVLLWDIDTGAFARASAQIRHRLDDLMEVGLLHEQPSIVAARIVEGRSLGALARASSLVHECAHESVSAKQELFRELDRYAADETILASASSAITASQTAGDVPGRGRCLVAHPVNPPYLLRSVELVPAPFTAPEVVERAAKLFSRAGMSPLVVRKEIEGFVFNRLQGALLREAYCLVRDGVVSVSELDAVVRNGLGLRWAIVGPFETADLNTRGGIAAHARKLGPAYARMGAERGQRDEWTPELVSLVTQARREILPLDRWDERVAWRDKQLMLAVRNRGS